MQKEENAKYAPGGPVLKKFHESNAFVRAVMGPLGSGKSTACTIEILRRSMLQKPSSDGKRKTRWAIIRNSYPELKTTTLKTWEQWVPRRFGKLTMDSPIKHHVVTPEMDMEVLFLALDRDEDVKKLLSLEITGAWVNEAREIPKGIIDGLTGRVGRYPSKQMGGCTWSGIIMDTNPPDDQSWWYSLSENETPKGWKFFKQPGGLSEHAENTENLPDNYYERMVAGKDQDWVNVYVNAEYGFVTEGKPVFPMYRDSVHASGERLNPIPGVGLLLGCDFGLTPAAVIGQKLVDGRWIIVDEFVADDSGVVRFAENLKSYVSRTYPEYEVVSGWGDPAGTKRSEIDERTAMQIMNEYTGWKWKAAPGENDTTIRFEAVKAALNRLVDGKPGLLLSSHAKTLRKGFSGGYHYKFIKTGNGTQVSERPNKNLYSHPMEALQYLLLGGGEHQVVLKSGKSKFSKGKPAVRFASGVDYDFFK